MKQLLTLKTAKMTKSAKLDHLSAILHLEPRYRVGKFNSCPMAGKCFATCLANSGRNRFDVNRASRLWKTKLFLEKQNEFFSHLIDNIDALIRKAEREGLKPTVRLNGTSDIAWEDIAVLDYANIMEMYPKLQFIDYTKIPERMLRKQPKNYHLTYSVNEKTPKGFVDRVYKETRFNCAQVYAESLPTYDNAGSSTVRRVLDGDVSDLRHLDRRNQIVGLTYKLAFVNDGKAFRPKRDNKFLRIIGEDNVKEI
jgi:hypothetical protein